MTGDQVINTCTQSELRCGSRPSNSTPLSSSVPMRASLPVSGL